MTTAAHVCVQSIHSCLFAILWNIASELQARILEWFAMPSFRESSWPRDWIRVSCGSWISGVFFTAETSGKPLMTIQFSSGQSLNCIQLFATPWTAARQVSLSITNSGAYSNSCPSSRWYHPTISSSVITFSSHLQSFPASESSDESVLHIRWPKYWSFIFSISLSHEYSGLTSFRMDWLDLLAVQGTLESLLQHHSSKASILWCSAFFIVQLLHPYMTTKKTIALIRWTIVGKVMSLLFNILSRFVIAFLPRGKCLFF